MDSEEPRGFSVGRNTGVRAMSTRELLHNTETPNQTTSKHIPNMASRLEVGR